MKAKKLEVMRCSIPTSFNLHNKNQGIQDNEVMEFASLKGDFNKGAIASCKLTNVVTKQGDIPT